MSHYTWPIKYLLTYLREISYITAVRRANGNFTSPLSLRIGQLHSKKSFVCLIDWFDEISVCWLMFFNRITLNIGILAGIKDPWRIMQVENFSSFL